VEAARLLRLAAGLRERVDEERVAMAREVAQVREEARREAEEARREAEEARRAEGGARREAAAAAEAAEREAVALRVGLAEAEAAKARSEATLIEVLADTSRKEDAAVLRMAEATAAEEFEKGGNAPAGRRRLAEARGAMLHRLVAFLRRTGDGGLLVQPPPDGEVQLEESEEEKAERLRYLRFRVFLLLYNAFREVSGTADVETGNAYAEAIPSGADADLASAPVAALAEALKSSSELRVLRRLRGPRNYPAWDAFQDDVDEGIQWVEADAAGAPPGAEIRWGALTGYFSEGVLRRRQQLAAEGGASPANSFLINGVKFTHRAVQTGESGGEERVVVVDPGVDVHVQTVEVAPPPPDRVDRATVTDAAPVSLVSGAAASLVEDRGRRLVLLVDASLSRQTPGDKGQPYGSVPLAWLAPHASARGWDVRVVSVATESGVAPPSALLDALGALEDGANIACIACDEGLVELLISGLSLADPLGVGKARKVAVLSEAGGRGVPSFSSFLALAACDAVVAWDVGAGDALLGAAAGTLETDPHPRALAIFEALASRVRCTGLPFAPDLVPATLDEDRAGRVGALRVGWAPTNAADCDGADVFANVCLPMHLNGTVVVSQLGPLRHGSYAQAPAYADAEQAIADALGGGGQGQVLDRAGYMSALAHLDVIVLVGGADFPQAASVAQEAVRCGVLVLHLPDVFLRADEVPLIERHAEGALRARLEALAADPGALRDSAASANLARAAAGIHFDRNWSAFETALLGDAVATDPTSTSS